MQEIQLTPAARHKMAALQGEVGDEAEGIRIFATPGGCSGMSFGLTFTDQISDEDTVCRYDDFALVIDAGTLEHIRGVEIDFASHAGDAQFLFHNLQPAAAGAGCNGCPSQGGGCA